MARKGGSSSKTSQVITEVRDTAVERFVVATLSRVGVLVPPWAVMGVLIGLSAVSHHLWGEPPWVIVATMAGTLGAVILSGLTWLVSHQRHLLGRVHATLTALFSVIWFTVATYTGVGSRPTLFAMFFGGGILALCWNVRAVIRMIPSADGTAVDPLAFLFDRNKGSFGLPAAKVRTTKAGEHRIEATLQLPAGEKIADDATKAAPYMASGMKLPPGSVTVSQDKDDASRALITISDPRVMEKPLPWIGPYRPGGSILDPLRVGMYQDMTEVLHTFAGHHLQIMGMIGSGKSIGGAWNYLAEIMSRRDTATFAIDISKADQTLGPCSEGIHKTAYTKGEAVALIRAMHAEIPQRTSWLSAHGYQKWAKGCGLLYWILWIEEYSKLVAALEPEDAEKLEEIVKEIRSAGGGVVISLQRNDYTQGPTLTRSQMAKMCFGVADEDDVKYGTTSRQRKAHVAPEEWGNNQPGMAYLDAPSIPKTHYAMALRTYAWGTTDEEAQAAMQAHAAQYPASAKENDEFTARVCGTSGTTTATVTQPRTAYAMPPAGTGPAHNWDDDAGVPEMPEDFGELLVAAAELVITTQFPSTSMLQRKLRVPHETCLRIMEALERRRIVGPQSGENSARRVLVSTDDARAVLEELKSDGDAVNQYVRTPDPSPEITAGPDDQIAADDVAGVDDGLETPQAQDRKATPEQARLVVYDWIRQRADTGRPRFTAGDDEFRTVRDETGMSRQWGYKVIKELVAVGVLRRESGDGASSTYTIVDLAPLDDPESVAA